VAKACGIWNVDKFEDEIPKVLVAEWNEYLDYELAQISNAITRAAPMLMQSAGLRSDSGGAIKLTNPEDIGGFFDAINKGI